MSVIFLGWVLMIQLVTTTVCLPEGQVCTAVITGGTSPFPFTKSVYEFAPEISGNVTLYETAEACEHERAAVATTHTSVMVTADDGLSATDYSWHVLCIPRWQTR